MKIQKLVVLLVAIILVMALVMGVVAFAPLTTGDDAQARIKYTPSTKFINQPPATFRPPMPPRWR